MKNLLLATFTILLMAGCGKSGDIRIKGNYNGTREDNLYLVRVDVDIPVLVDSVKIHRNGKFSIRFDSDQPNFYNLGFDNKEFITLLAYPGDNIGVTFDGPMLQDSYTITGSPESEKVKMLDQKLSATISKLDSLRSYYKSSAGIPGFDTLGPRLEEEYSNTINDQRRNNIAFILDNLTSFASVKALYQRFDEETYVLYQEKDLQYLKLVSDSLNRYYPKSKQAKALASNLENELNAMYMNRISALTEEMESTSLDAELPDIDGRMVRLSSLQKKNWVILTFWSAESNDCISNNLQLKEYYKLYNRQGLEIYQVNVDASEELWRDAVSFDDLPWISVRDFENGVSKTARLFNVKTLPANYLINPEGEIVGKNLFGKSMQIKLSQIFD